jgi:hypothetical protein
MAPGFFYLAIDVHRKDAKNAEKKSNFFLYRSPPHNKDALPSVIVHRRDAKAAEKRKYPNAPYRLDCFEY